MVTMPEVHELFEWLRGLAFIESGALGLFPHDVAREALVTDLRWRNPDWYAELHHRARNYYAVRLKLTYGQEQQRVLFDYVYLHRDNPTIRPFLEWQEAGVTLPGAMREGDGGWRSPSSSPRTPISGCRCSPTSTSSGYGRQISGLAGDATGRTHTTGGYPRLWPGWICWSTGRSLPNRWPCHRRRPRPW